MNAYDVDSHAIMVHHKAIISELTELYKHGKIDHGNYKQSVNHCLYRMNVLPYKGTKYSYLQ